MGKSQTKAKNKYNEKTYDRINLVVKKGVKDIWKSEAEQQGLSLNAFICRALNQYIESEKTKRYNRILSKTIDALNLSVRSYNCLYRSGINTIGDLKRYLDENSSLNNVRNLGNKNADEVIDRLIDFEKKNGITLNIDYNHIPYKKC